MNIKNWSQAGCTITLDPKTAETLIEWRCPAGYAAEIHEYKVGIDDDYVSLPHPALEIRLVFETLVGRDVIHINPGSEKLQKFSKKVTLIAHNKTDKPLIVWGSLRGTTIAVVSEGTAKVIEETTTIEETAMIDDALENSHVGMKKLAPTALGVVASQDSPPSYEEGDAAALLTDKNGRLLVSIDALTPEAEEQFNRVSEADVTLQERLMEAQSEVERQQTENQLRILREISMRVSRLKLILSLHLLTTSTMKLLLRTKDMLAPLFLLAGMTSSAA